MRELQEFRRHGEWFELTDNTIDNVKLETLRIWPPTNEKRLVMVKKTSTKVDKIQLKHRVDKSRYKWNITHDQECVNGRYVRTKAVGPPPKQTPVLLLLDFEWYTGFVRSRHIIGFYDGTAYFSLNGEHVSTDAVLAWARLPSHCAVRM